ncbi:Hypothetical predicted protein [Mytilus galloprovincialis]|uniref:Mab-21-like HhH/H2TH-like domain-containing protein n=1 Tax=Mytilus galloprovincialis TaxID=29158 RepID=A0A8B6HQD5_MYTGA|nr:Hypothetical predicted protein [Mytilus galloprovincialis]
MKFLQTLEDHNLTQHISTATHIRGHTLDLFITRSESNLLRTKASVHEPNLFDARGNPFCDHHAIQAVLAGAKPKKISKTFTFRKWKTVDQVELSKDIVLDIPDTNPSVDELANQYDSELRDVVEKHAPLVTKSVLLRPNTQWYSDELLESKRNRRRAERKWRETGLEIHRQIFKERCSNTGKLLHQTKQDFFSKKIEDCSGDHKQLFKLSNSLMGKQHDIVLPTSTSNTELSNKFAHFFINKVTTIRNVLSQQHSFNRELSLAEDTPFNGDLFWRGNDPREQYLYEQLVQIVGTEIDIRKRQRLFILFDMYINACMLDRAHISSGSLAEGIDLPGSDIDIMYVIRNIYVIQNAFNSSIKQPKNRIEFVMETDIDHPGFTRLKRNSKYLPVNNFLNIFKTNNCNVPLYSHGPCLSTRELTVDIAFCLRSKYLPQNVNSWAFRHRWQWPPHFVIDKIIQYGCLIVPIGPKTVSDDISLWRFSFSVAEKMIVHSFNFTQYLCYGLLKLMLKRVINTHDEVKDLLCSYFLKTALFWVSEEHDINRFQLTKLSYCFSLCLSKLITWVNICYCPNYFIPEHNMFQGKINKSNNTILLRVLGGIQSGGIDGLIMNLFPTYNRSLLVKNSESSSTMLDFLFYRIDAIKARETEIAISYKKLAFIDSLIKSESSTFIVDVCKYYYAQSSQIIAQSLPPPNTKGQFNVTLRLTDYVLSRCSPDMMLSNDFACKVHKKCYRQNIHSTTTLIERMKTAAVCHVSYIINSSLIPEELQLEVKDQVLFIPPTVMSHCLRFLCFHHLGDILNRQQSLRDLYLTVKGSYLVPICELSISITIVGVCLEISGDKDKAYQCYEEALKVDHHKT